MALAKKARKDQATEIENSKAKNKSTVKEKATEGQRDDSTIGIKGRQKKRITTRHSKGQGEEEASANNSKEIQRTTEATARKQRRKRRRSKATHTQVEKNKRSTDRTIHRSSDRAIERWSGLANDRSSIRTTERPNVRATERPSDHAIERPNDEATEQPSDRAIQRRSDQATQRPSDRTKFPLNSRLRIQKQNHMTGSLFMTNAYLATSNNDTLESSLKYKTHVFPHPFDMW